MTVEEIKQNNSMPDVIRRYGIEIHRGGMCSCPFHKDQHPSMKVFKDGFYCFSCGASGDIFTFVQMQDGLDFKSAFKLLGGTYERYKNDAAKYQARSKIMAERSRKQISQTAHTSPQTGGKLFNALIEAIEVCEGVKRTGEPFSEVWCEAVNTLPELEYYYQYLFCQKQDNKDDVNGLYIYQRCRKVKQRVNP